MRKYSFYVISICLFCSCFKVQVDAKEQKVKATLILDRMRSLNKNKQFSEVEALFLNSKVNQWSRNQEWDGYDRNEKNPPDLTGDLLLKIYGEYSFALWKLEKFNECREQLSQILYPGGFILVSDDHTLPSKSAVEFNTFECVKSWEKKFTKGRKSLLYKSCNKKKRSFQLDSNLCLQIKFVRQTENGKEWVEGKFENTAIHIDYIIGNNKAMPIKIITSNSQIPNDNFSLQDEDFRIELYSDPDPNKILIRLSGSTLAAEGGTGRGGFDLFGILNKKNKSFEVLNEVDEQYH